MTTAEPGSEHPGSDFPPKQNEPNGSTGPTTGVLGVVLCGGKSERMGSDKGLLRFSDEETWAARALEILRKLDLPVVLSINPLQDQAYARTFPRENRILDTETTGGPLRGILSVHAKFPRQNLLVLACDMLHIPRTTLDLLLNAYRADGSRDAYAFRANGRLEPLCAIYSSRLLARYDGSTKAPRRLLDSPESLIITRDETSNEFESLNSPRQARDFRKTLGD